MASRSRSCGQTTRMSFMPSCGPPGIVPAAVKYPSQPNRYASPGERPARRDAPSRLALVIDARTDVVGSLLRPPELLEARERHERGELSRAELDRAEDAAVDWALRLQEEAGLEVVTDGEMRRLSFQSQMTEAVDGFGDWDLDAFLWGEWHSEV